MRNLKKLTVKEIMNDDLLTLTDDTPIDEAIRTLEEYHITGAPVLNSGGELVGVFSTTDVLKRRVETEAGEAPRAGDYFASDPFSDDPDEYFGKEDYDDVVLGRDTVGQWMTTEVKAVTPETSVSDVCRRMVTERVHRLLVMEGKELRGIVSTFDIVRLVAGNESGEA
jgi:CBS domain-containing protein